MATRSLHAHRFAHPPIDGVVDAVGNTPLVRLRRIAPNAPFDIYAKLEGQNPGGSAKDRPAARIIADAMERGEVTEHTTVVESTSGNFGVGLAQACRYFGLPLVCVVDGRTSDWNRRRMVALGADVHVVTEPDAATGELLPARIARVRAIMAELGDVYWPSQYSNPANPAAHRDGTMREIDDALDGGVDWVFVATSTTGTLRGCHDYITAAGRRTRLVAVDAFGSALFGGRQGPRRLPGLGAGMATELSREARFDDLVRVTDLDCVVGCRRLATREALLAGASSGGVTSALRLRENDIEPGSTCVLIFPDGASSYLTTVFDDDWVSRELDCSRDDLARIVDGP